VSIKHKLCQAFFCLALGWASLAGTPMRPEEIEELMHQMNQPKVSHTLPEEDDRGLDWDYNPEGTIENSPTSR
jgi:hypothetical protein